MAQPGLTEWARAELVARASYGRLLAVLAAPTGDIPAAEDALSEAFLAALTVWPTSGVPDNPEGWLITVARNRLRDRWKSAAFRTSAPLDDLRVVTPGTLGDEAFERIDADGIGDKRLELLFVCAHPAIDAGIRSPLMLQTVLGVESARIAAVFAVPEAAMAQRLVRAKRRIRDARIPFAIPTRGDMPTRLPAVLEAIYAAYALDWQTRSTPLDSLAGEALYLAETLAALLPDEPEVLGLLALLELSQARESARISASGEPIALDDQNTALWDTALIHRGEAHLRRAHELGEVGRFQLEAAIQSAHCDRARSGSTDWAALTSLHAALVRIAPTLGARVALAATIGEADGAVAGLSALDAVAGVEKFQPAWATRAPLLARSGRAAEAVAAYETAAALTEDAGVRDQLRVRAAGIRSPDA